ncbi:MAG: hypothetical protein KDF59_15345 [Nitrosomonas sp.]|nr:hypothetical protein [Nitrosomonas sp.]
MCNNSLIIECLWKDLQFRQSHYWDSFNRFSFVIILINISPYIRPEIAEPLGKMIFAFPISALLLSVICTWYLGAEYQRLAMIRKAYQELLNYNDLVPRMPEDGVWNKLVSLEMGRTIPIRRQLTCPVRRQLS